jgi:uncharacterized protein (TIGR00369 family)
MNLVEQIAPGMSGLETLKALIKGGGQPPIGERLDFVFVDAGDGWAVFEGHPSASIYNPIGTVHGGFAATLLDSACGCAVHSKLSEKQMYTTLELKVAYHRAITEKTGIVKATGRVQSFGRRAAFATADLLDERGRLYASATSTLLIMDRQHQPQ